MKPAWDQLGDEYEGSSVVVGDVDCTEDKNRDLCSKYGVSGYPTIKYMNIDTEDATGESYNGGRDFDSLKSFVEVGRCSNPATKPAPPSHPRPTLLRGPASTVVSSRPASSACFGIGLPCPPATGDAGKALRGRESRALQREGDGLHREGQGQGRRIRQEAARGASCLPRALSARVLWRSMARHI